MNYPIIIGMPRHESITDLEKSLKPNEEKKEKHFLKNDCTCPVFMCFICIGVLSVSSYLIYESQFIEDGSL